MNFHSSWILFMTFIYLANYIMKWISTVEEHDYLGLVSNSIGYFSFSFFAGSCEKILLLIDRLKDKSGPCPCQTISDQIEIFPKKKNEKNINSPHGTVFNAETKRNWKVFVNTASHGVCVCVFSCCSFVYKFINILYIS